MSRNLQQVPDHIERPSCVAIFEAATGIQLIRVSGVAAEYPIISGTRFEGRQKPDPTRTSGTRTPLEIVFNPFPYRENCFLFF